MNEFCSPANENNKYCFSKKSLLNMISVWNSLKIQKINVKNTMTSRMLFNYLYNVMNKYCPKHKYWLWAGIIEKLAEKKGLKNIERIKRKLRLISKKELKPEKPESWYRNPKTWLSNFDIQNVMFQYKMTKKYKYDFLGVFPIDFSTVSINGTCLYSEFCNMDIKNYVKKGIKFIGFITNLDKHDEPGSHWTSSFIVIDPSLPTFGAYYYDSTGRPMPVYLQNFMNNIKKQCNELYPNTPFNIIQNKKQHQYKNSECGVFSMLFQLRWINKHIVKKNNTSFEEIIGNPYINDEQMLKIRDHLFRPNTKMELKKIQI
jgi:hypothetical protein